MGKDQVFHTGETFQASPIFPDVAQMPNGILNTDALPPVLNDQVVKLICRESTEFPPPCRLLAEMRVGNHPDGHGRSLTLYEVLRLSYTVFAGHVAQSPS